MTHPRDRQFPLGRRGSHPRHLQARQVPGRHPAAHRPAAARLRPGADEGEGPRDAGRSSSGKKLENLDPQLRKASGFAFYNTSRYDFEKLARRRAAPGGQPAQLHRRLQPEHARGAREVRLRQHDQQARRSRAALPGLERFKNVDLHPDRVDNPTMGTIFEELIRKFNEALNENPGEHFTPRDVVHLMVGPDARRRREAHPRKRAWSAPSTTPAAARAAC